MQLKTIQAFLQKKLEQKTRGIISIQAFLQKTGGIILFILLTAITQMAISMPQLTSSVETEFGTYVPNISNVKPDVKPYAIDPDLKNVTNLDKFEFTGNEKSILAKNGFVASPSRFKQVYDIYKNCQELSIPAFVTTDSVLHTYHILYDYALRIMETSEFFNDLKNLNSVMLDKAISVYNEATNLRAKMAAQKNVAYFTVASVLLDPSTAIPPYVSEMVEKELTLIGDHAGFSASPIFGYEEDYSQYVPRGHYTRSEKLGRFFRSMMWYGRISFRLSPREGEEKGIDETLQAILIVAAMKDAIIDGKPAIVSWDRIYAPTVFFVGKADDLNVYEYMDLLDHIYGSDYSADNLADTEKVKNFIESARKMRNPMISSSWVWEGEKIEDVTKGFRFMGQRFIPDSYMFQQLVHDAVSGRMLPRGLDVMAIMGSERAYNILISIYGENRYANYTNQIDKLRTYFTKMDDEVWAQNLYWNWLYVLMPLLTPKGNGYPAFMQKEAWLDKSLTTSLGSWAELRHDTILYAKQSYTRVTSVPVAPALSRGYVEPDPELYARLAALARFTMDGLSNRGLLLPEFASKFGELEELLLSLKEISELELINQPLTREHYGIIINIGKTLQNITSFPPEIASQIEGQEDNEMAVIADVHTDPNSGQVLEVGVGYPSNIFVIVPVDGELRITQGGMFSYYEFAQTMDNRLTDGEWQKMLSDNPPELPIWAGSFISLSESRILGMRYNSDSEMSWYPTEIQVSINPEVIDIGNKIEVYAEVQGNLDSPLTIIVKQGDLVLKNQMDYETDYYFASIETRDLKPGTAQITIEGISGEEEIVYNGELTLIGASAVDGINDVYEGSESKKHFQNRLYLAYPNPFNPEVWIPYELSNGGDVTIEIYNVLGQLIRSFDLGYKASGKYLGTNKAAYWDGRNSNGEHVSSGVYFYRLKAGSFVASGKLIALK